MSKPSVIDVERVRGDTYPEIFQVTIDGAAQDITGATFLLTVDPSPSPPDDTTMVFEIVGAIVDALLGKVGFTPSVGQAGTAPATYYYDLQMTESGGAVRTVAKGKWKISQDVTK